MDPLLLFVLVLVVLAAWGGLAVHPLLWLVLVLALLVFFVGGGAGRWRRP